jgi:integrase
MIYKRGRCKLAEDGRCPKCGRRGACGVYWYKFMWHGTLVRESTKQGNDKIARQMESAHRTSLARGEVGLREKKVAPTLRQFIENRFEPWARGTFEKSSPKTWRDYYKVGIKTILAYRPLADSLLDEITSESASAFAASRRAEGKQVSTVNSSLQILRRMVRLSAEWGVIDARVPMIRMMPGERRREHVVTEEEEARYLAAAPELVGKVASVLVDTGLRPEECFRLRWEAITWSNGRHGTFLVTHGKTPAARRVLPMSRRVKNILEARWENAGKPMEGWVWPAPTRSGHLESSSLKKQHANCFRTIAEEAKKNNQNCVRRFVLYSLRHTFLTRLGESGCDAWTLARIAGHSSVAMSSRYVHPSENAVLMAVERLGGHRIGHRPEVSGLEENSKRQVPS